MGYRVIIADDGPKILQLIKLLGRWEKYDIEIIDECHNGNSTSASIKQNHKMPDLDGIELIEATRKEGINSLFILISGYRHFEYARSAIAMNVVDYILKPIDEEELNRTLEKVCKQIAQSKEEQEDKAELFKIRAQQNRNKMERLMSKYFKEWCIYYYHITYRGCIIVLNYALKDKKQIKRKYFHPILWNP